jgi:hypothetical protein
VTGRLLASGGAEINGTGVRPDVELPVSDDDCLVQFARTLIVQARDPQRSTLLSTAKSLPVPADCRSAEIH